MKQNLIIANEIKDKLAKEKENLNAKIQEKLDTINTYKKELEEKDELINTIKNLNDKLEKENKDALNNAANNDIKINNLNDKYENLKKNYEINKGVFEELNNKYQEITRTNNKLQAENMLLKEKFEKVNSDLVIALKEKNDTNGSVSSKIIDNSIKENENTEGVKKKMMLKNTKKEKILDDNENKKENEKIDLSDKLTDEKLKSNNLKKGSDLNDTELISIKIPGPVLDNTIQPTQEDKKNELPIEKKSSAKIDIIEGSRFIFKVFDSKRILRFDLENRQFKVLEFADFGSFEDNFNPEGSIYLNTTDGLFIVTGDNHDLFYYFSLSKVTMNKLAKLNDNHSHGALIFYHNQKNLICISGWHNRKVENYTNEELIGNMVRDDIKPVKTKLPNNTWSYLPEISVERSESSYLIINNKTLLAFFGYCCPKAKYIDTVEYLDLSNPLKWEILKFSNEKHVSTWFKSHSAVNLNNEEILLIGGFNGMKEMPTENFIKFDFKNNKNEISQMDRKLPDIIFNHCYNFQKDSMFVPFVDINKRLHYASIDEMDNVHIIEVNSWQYDILKFD